MYCGLVAGWKYPAEEKSDENIGAFGFGVPKLVEVAFVAEAVVLLAGLRIGSTRENLLTGSGRPYFFPSACSLTQTLHIILTYIGSRSNSVTMEALITAYGIY